MTPKYEKIIVFHKILDIFLTGLAFTAAYFIKQNLTFPYGGLSPIPQYDIILLLIIIIWYAAFSFFMPYDLQNRQLTFRTFYSLCKATAVSLILLLLCLFFFKVPEFSRLLITIFFLLDLTLLTVNHMGVQRFIHAGKNEAYFRRNLLILGSRKTAREIIQSIRHGKDATINIIGCLETTPNEVGQEVADGVRVIGALENIREILTNHVVDEVLIAMPLNQIENSEWYLSFINTFGITTRIIPHWYIRKFMASRPKFYSVQFEDFLAEPAMVLGPSFQKNEELIFKRVCDYIIAVTGLLLAAPLFPIFVCAIKLVSKGPVFYTQRRCGLYGRTFDVYKFRTMVVEAETFLPNILHLNEASGAVFKMKDDPRIIPYVGNFLRKTSLDELPQLINVLRGEMSIIGPRPPIPQEVEKYELWQRRRLAMRPGITCLWQIQKKRNDISFDEWMDMDLDYIDNWSIGLDLKILWWTIPAVLLGRGR